MLIVRLKLFCEINADQKQVTFAFEDQNFRYLYLQFFFFGAVGTRNLLPDIRRPSLGSDSILEFLAGDSQLHVSLHNSETQLFLQDKTFVICRQVPGSRSIHLPRVE